MANVTLCKAILDGNMQTLNAIISVGVADINSVDSGGYSALILASEKGHVDAIKTLIEGGSNVNYAILAGPGVYLENIGMTALMGACMEGMKDAVKVLLDANADVFHTRSNGSTALSISIQFKHTAIIDMLKAHIAQRDTKLEGSSK